VDPAVAGDLLVGTYEGFARRMAEMKERPDLAGWARSLLVVLYEGLIRRPGGERLASDAARPRAPARGTRASLTRRS
jgi:hypothetical protein